MSDIQPFSVQISDADLNDLKQRLALTRWPDKETPDDWSQGVPLSYMQEIHKYWLESYDWRAGEKKLNEWPGFKTEIEGLDIHFLHIRSKHENATPMIMTHGWPGSVLEFSKVIGPLTDPQAHGGHASDAFHLICPTLPGFGFSGKPKAPGWNIERIATAWDTLMQRLGYNSYLAQGGDWGAIVTSMIGSQNLGQCQGIHITMPIVGPDPDTMDSLEPIEQDALAAIKFRNDHDGAYAKQQGTRPQTLGYGLADSPIGQAAWILEKFYQWMDCKGLPENIVTRDELLDNIMIYWLTDTAASSARIYWEATGSNLVAPVTIPSAISIFPKEIFKTSERWARRRFTRLEYFNLLNEGGHFAAFEQPEAFVNEVRTAFRTMR